MNSRFLVRGIFVLAHVCSSKQKQLLARFTCTVSLLSPIIELFNPAIAFAASSSKAKFTKP